MQYSQMSKDELQKELDALTLRMDEMKGRNLALDLSRGKPDSAQLDLSMETLDVINSKSVTDSISGMDCRNYGALDGLPETKQLFAEVLGTTPDHILVGGNSSLTLMFDFITHAMVDGILGEKPQLLEPNRKFLCPVPGYDRHFGITEHFGYELVTVPMLEDGPDMDVVQQLVESDPTIKGIWCVPKYANPTGVVYSDRVVKRFAALNPAAPDFRIYWDNAYCVHTLYPDQEEEILDIISECEAAGHPDMVYEFTSSSKMSFPGGGVAVCATSLANLIDIKKFLMYSTIGPDKLNQLRQVRFFKNLSGVRSHMVKHADIMRPKFEAVLEILDKELGGLGIAEWTTPKGGYFISFNTMKGMASRAVNMCREAGVVFTPAGATYPYGNDPDDKNIRIAPSFAKLDDIKVATELFTVALKIVTINDILLTL